MGPVLQLTVAGQGTPLPAGVESSQQHMLSNPRRQQTPRDPQGLEFMVGAERPGLPSRIWALTFNTGDSLERQYLSLLVYEARTRMCTSQPVRGLIEAICVSYS